MLKRPVSLALALALACVSNAAADASSIPSALLPRRALTAGGHDHFHGQLSRDGTEIYFAANADSTIEIFVQNLTRGFPRLLFDDAADVDQPRLSPDGRRLLYVSYQRDAGGDACVVDTGGGGRRCLTRQGVAVLHVFWFPDGRTVGALTRRQLDAVHELRRFSIDEQDAEGALILEENMSAPAISPDGSWLAYVPLERPDGERSRGGLMRASWGLRLRRVDGSSTRTFVPDLPGTSSFPAFSLDGTHLYFTQYLNDTNFDGVIDGDDNGVLFRVPWRADADPPVRGGTYQQLTSGRTDCQYPAPARDALVATCVRSGHLQIDAMPLDGLVQTSWSRERIEAEIEASRDPWEQLLLLQRMISMEDDVTRRDALRRRLVMTHLGLREYESADYFLGALARDQRDAGLAEWIEIQREIVGHRREEQRLNHGNLSSEFIASSRDRLERLEAHFVADSPPAQRLARIAESEIYLVLGDKAAAMRMFEAIDVEGETDVSVLQMWMRLAESLLRDLGERERWMDVHRALSAHPALDERDRLFHAEELITVLGRGRTPGTELPRIRAERERTPDGTEVALMLDLEWALARVPTIGEEAAEAEIDRLWRSAPTFEQHRAVALTTIDRAVRHDWGRLLLTFGRRWLDDVPRGHVERRYAEALYAEVMLERAYVERSQRRPTRALFREITEQTPSLEAHVGYIEASLAEGVAPDAIRAQYRARFPEPDDPIERFAEAYVVARGLPSIDDPERHAAEIARARALLRPAGEALPRSPEIHQIYAYLAHRHYHRTGDNEAALAAHSRYHLALDLTVGAPRLRANLLAELGLLQAALGNHQIALRHFEERERLPFVDPESELSFRLAKARSLFHGASYASARAEATRALSLLESTPRLHAYRALVLDRAALYHYASGEHEAAVTLYEQLVEATADQPLAVRLKARLGLGAAALAAGHAESARERLEEARRMLDSDEPFRTGDRQRHALSHFELDDYRPLVAGLLAQSRRAAGDVEGAAVSLEERRELYRARHLRYGRDVYLLELARISQQLAEHAYRTGDVETARARLEEGVVEADRWRRTEEGTEIDEVTLALVRSAAELHLYGGVPLSAFAFDVTARLRETYAIITRRPNPRWADERSLFPMYLTMLEIDAR